MKFAAFLPFLSGGGLFDNVSGGNGVTPVGAVGNAGNAAKQRGTGGKKIVCVTAACWESWIISVNAFRFPFPGCRRVPAWAAAQ